MASTKEERTERQPPLTREGNGLISRSEFLIDIILTRFNLRHFNFCNAFYSCKYGCNFALDLFYFQEDK